MVNPAESVENRIIELFVNVCSEFGQDSSAAKIFSIIFLSPTEISLEELMEKTGYSRATISNKTRMLEKISHIRKLSKPGTKKCYFYMDKDRYI
jgi:DNA-binding transcriptional regulator GbsR (MarR family)